MDTTPPDSPLSLGGLGNEEEGQRKADEAKVNTLDEEKLEEFAAKLKADLRESIAVLRDEIRGLSEVRHNQAAKPAAVDEDDDYFPLGQGNLVDDDDDEEMEEPSKRQGRRRLRAGGQESLDEYARLSNSISEGFGHAFEKALRGQNDFKAPSKDDMERDLFERKMLMVDKIIVRAQAGELQKLLGMSLSEQVTTAKVRDKFKKGSTNGLVVRGILATAGDVVNHFLEGLNDIRGTDVVPKALMEEFGKYLEAFVKLSLVMVRVGIAQPQLADSVNYTLAQTTCAKFNEARDPRVMVEYLNRTNLDLDVAELVAAEKRARERIQTAVENRDRVCYAFRDGGFCRFGDSCRFKHGSGPTSGADGAKRRRLSDTSGTEKKGSAALRKLIKKTQAAGGYQPYPGAKK